MTQENTSNDTQSVTSNAATATSSQTASNGVNPPAPKALKHQPKPHRNAVQQPKCAPQLNPSLPCCLKLCKMIFKNDKTGRFTANCKPSVTSCPTPLKAVQAKTLRPLHTMQLNLWWAVGRPMTESCCIKYYAMMNANATNPI